MKYLDLVRCFHREFYIGSVVIKNNKNSTVPQCAIYTNYSLNRKINEYTFLL